MLAVDKIYVAHYSPLIERRERLEPILKEFGNEVEWVSNEPTQEDLSSFFTWDKETWDTKMGMLYRPGEHPFRQMKKAEISLAFKHLLIYKKMLEEQHSACLVLEDDVVFEKDFLSEFNLQLSLTPPDADAVFIGSGCDLHISQNLIQAGQFAYRKSHPASKCTDSYILYRHSVEKMVNSIIPCSFPIDYEMNHNFFINRMNVYWWEPTLVRQGSQTGLYRTEIQ